MKPDTESFDDGRPKISETHTDHKVGNHYLINPIKHGNTPFRLTGYDTDANGKQRALFDHPQHGPATMSMSQLDKLKPVTEAKIDPPAVERVSEAPKAHPDAHQHIHDALDRMTAKAITKGDDAAVGRIGELRGQLHQGRATTTISSSPGTYWIRPTSTIWPRRSRPSVRRPSRLRGFQTTLNNPVPKRPTASVGRVDHEEQS